MRSFLSSLGVAGVVSACLVSSAALANSAGISGRSGRDGSSLTCAECHSGGGAAATVTIEGPTTLAPGATGNYSIIVRGGPAVGAGYNVAVSEAAATLNTSGSGSRKLSGELTHSTIRRFTNGEARFDFTMVAPASAGRVTLFGAGNSVNENGTEQGDSSATTTLEVNVASGGGNGGDGDGNDDSGCAAAGGVPLLGAALVLLSTRLRRRR